MQHDFTKKYCSQCWKSKYILNSNGKLILYCHSLNTKVKFLNRNDTRATDCRWFVPERKEELLQIKAPTSRAREIVSNYKQFKKAPARGASETRNNFKQLRKFPQIAQMERISSRSEAGGSYPLHVTDFVTSILSYM